MPSQAPPQEVPSVSQAARPPWGAPATGVQVPSLPAASQASHWPPQAWLQHTPSVQKPLPHWSEAVQVAPGAFFGVQTPAAHQLPAVQSPSTVQSPPQAVAPQLNGAQFTVCGAGQLPAPSQLAARVATPAVQDAPRQLVELPG